MSTSIDTKTSETPVPPEHEPALKHILRIAMRWKLLAAFAGVFTIVFLFIAIYVVHFSTNNAQKRLVDQLASTAAGASSTINAEQFVELISTVPAVPDAKNQFGFGYPTSQLYKDQAQALVNINKISGEALTYTYFKDPKDGQLYAAASSGYYLNPQIGYTYKVPIGKTSNAETNRLMMEGLTTSTEQPAYSDGYGSWISRYVPIVDKNGKTVGGFGVDYPLTYVDEVRADVQKSLYPVLIVTYLVLLGLVLLVSTSLVRPLKRLTVATKRIADGEYDLDVRKLVRTRFPDEMYELADSFAQMAKKVGARERSLTQEVQRLKVEIDQSRREEAVSQITDNDDFAALAQKAQEMRKRMREGLGKE